MDIYAVRERIKKENINFMSLPLRVTFYARVSTEFNVQLNSLDNQITYYTDFIKNNPNWEYVEGYVDEGISGVSTAKRERFNEMIEDGKQGLFDLVITKEVSRFARNTLDSIRFTRELLSSGVAVYFQNDNINTLDEDSELRLTIMSSMAQDESRKISTRVRFGHQQAIKKGTVLGTNNMFGYTKKDGKLTINEEEAAFIRELFEMYATGRFSMKQMEKHFYEKGIRNRKGNKLSHSTMGNIIRNPKYKGYYVGNKVVITDLFTKKQKFLPEDEWVMYKDETGEIVPAIVSEELWEKANEVLYMRSQDVITAQHKTVHQNLFTGKLICAHCGKPYYRKDAVGKGGEKMSKWVCSGKIYNGADSCPSHAIYESEIKPVIEDIFRSGQQNIEELSACVLKLVSELLESDDKKNELLALSKEIETQHKMKAKLLKFNADGNMSDSEFFRMTAECDEEITKLQAQMDAIKDNAKTEQEIKKELSNIRAILKAAEKHIDGEEIDKTFVDRYIKEIIVYPEEDVTRLDIRLNAGTSVEKILENTRSRTGHMSKKMIKAYEESMK
ncbi:MAG TPA: recombinase family protein [Candidatus Eubacterium faecigallinarum]|nr:recombinase family protein [Candidatus Eubacterium faecigallinarum]